jgi:ubiquinone/menaquinone biosynthesis C-methylase UbiE
MNQTQAFANIAENYDRARPDYPETAVDGIVQTIRAIPSVSQQVADIGSGTGIFTRMLRQHLPETFTVVGIEPGHDMRQLAQQQSSGTIDYL